MLSETETLIDMVWYVDRCVGGTMAGAAVAGVIVCKVVKVFEVASMIGEQVSSEFKACVYC